MEFLKLDLDEPFVAPQQVIRREPSPEEVLALDREEVAFLRYRGNRFQIAYRTDTNGRVVWESIPEVG